MTIAILITTFNRKAKTLACLERLREQPVPNNARLTVYLTDDASSDGTAEAAASAFPDIHIFHGNGSLFWAGGMRRSWQEAQQHHPDFYLLINDDTILKPDALRSLFSTYQHASEHYGKPVICVGSTSDMHTGKTSYGGRKLVSAKKVINYLVENNDTFAECDLGNANIMLVPRQVVDEIGILSGAYTHGIADYDYTLTAKKKGFPVLVAPGILGVCADDNFNHVKAKNKTLKERIRYLYSPKGLAYNEYLYFIKTHFPSHYPAAFGKLWLRTLFPFLWNT